MTKQTKQKTSKKAKKTTLQKIEDSWNELHKNEAQLGTSEEGNTNSSSRARKWVFTLNNYTEYDFKSLHNYMAQMAQKYIIGKEVGKKGTPHLQGFVEWKNPKRFDEMKNLNYKMHLGVAYGSAEENLIYCSKDGNFVTNIYVEKPKILEDCQLYDWQKKILNIIENEEPDDRTINWIYNEKGKGGKSNFAKYLFYHKKAMYLRSGTARDIKNILFDNKFARDIIIDLTRSKENFVSYTLMEELKDGFLFSTKFEGGAKLITTPHIFVFANFKPDTTKLSLDRWNIQELINDEFIDITQECIKDDQMLL